MTKLEELIFSLATVIVSYHDTQIKISSRLVSEIDPMVLRKKSRDYAAGIINDAETKYSDRLQALIEFCTKGYPDRKHFLSFILHEAIFLKTQHVKKAPYTKSELEELQQQITQLLTDFKGLLLTEKKKLYKVTYSALGSDSKTRVDLAGLINDAYIGNHFCNSGLLVLNEVLGRFHMTEATTDEEIREIANSLCTEHQNALLVSSLRSKLIESENAAAQTKPKIEELTQSLEDTQSKLKAAELLIEDLKNPKESAQIKSPSSEAEGLRRALEEAQAKLKEAELQITELKKQKVQKTHLGHYLGLASFAQHGTFYPRDRFFLNPLNTNEKSEVEKQSDQINFEM